MWIQTEIEAGKTYWIAYEDSGIVGIRTFRLDEQLIAVGYYTTLEEYINLGAWFYEIEQPEFNPKELV